MLSLEHINLRRGPELLLEDASFVLHKGTRVGVVGRIASWMAVGRGGARGLGVGAWVCGCAHGCVWAARTRVRHCVCAK